jgi:hypothetical protein
MHASDITAQPDDRAAPTPDEVGNMKTTTTALAAAGMLALASVMVPASADAGCRGCGLAAGIIGGIAAGAIIGGAIANSA